MDRRVERALEIMRRDFHRHLCMSGLSAAVNLSTSRLSRLFREEVGSPPKKYLARFRLERAKVMLEETFLTIKQVMVAVGMRDPSHFSRDFRRHHGLTPTRLRAMSAGGKSD